MKILFICSSLEPGRDGVGDYTRRIASALIHSGHSAVAIALNDKHISEKADYTQNTEDIDMPVLRIPQNVPSKQRIEYAKKYIHDFNPDWLSLQFVIFGYQAKGLPFTLANQLLLIAAGRRWHIMFHELWIGMAKESPLKQQYWGVVQKFIITQLIKKINPAVIHTQCELYQVQLKSIKAEAGILPLFGNFPKTQKSPPTHAIYADDHAISMVMLGTIHPNTLVEQFASEIADYLAHKNICFKLTIIGRAGNEQGRWINIFNKMGLRAEALGELPGESISEILAEATIGISTTAYVMTDKSGTVATMREHGLPVICISDPYHPRYIKKLRLPSGVAEYAVGNFIQCIKQKASKSDNDPAKTAVMLIKSLEAAQIVI